MAFAIAIFTLTSCESVPMPYDLPEQGEGTTGVDPTGSGTAADPYNIAALNNFARNLDQGASSEGLVYFRGKVVSFKSGEEPGNSYGNATFYMSDDGSSNNQFYVYRCKGPGNSKITDPELFKIGDELVVCGKITNYNGTLETEQNTAYIISINGEGSDNPGTTAEPTGSGTATDPYNVAKANEVCAALEKSSTSASYLSDEVFVKGKVSSITDTELSSFGNITYYISDDGTTAGALEVYRGFGLGGAKFTSLNDIKVGDEVVVKGKLQNWLGTYEFTQGSSLASLNGESGSNGGNNDQPGDATEITCAKAVEICNGLEDKTETTELYTITGYITETDGKISREQQVFWMADTKNGGKVFEAYWANIPDPTKALPVGTKVKMTGKLMRYGTTPEMKNGTVVVLEAAEGNTDDNGGGNQDNPGTGAGLEDFTNGDFEAWDGSTPVNWKSACSASSASLAQSTDAHGGTYAVTVKGVASANKRLAYKELTLEAGTYTFSLYAKATTENAAQIRLGYVPVTDGAVGSYVYNGYETINTSWGKYSYTFNLDAKTTICLVVMNPKKSNYSSGEDVLIDDATFEKN